MRWLVDGDGGVADREIVSRVMSCSERRNGHRDVAKRQVAQDVVGQFTERHTCTSDARVDGFSSTTSTEDDRHEVELVQIWSFMIILMNCPCLNGKHRLAAHPIYIEMHCRRLRLGHQAVIFSQPRVISINLVTLSPAFLTDPQKHPSWRSSASSPDQPLSSSSSPTHSPQPCHP